MFSWLQYARAILITLKTITKHSYNYNYQEAPGANFKPQIITQSAHFVVKTINKNKFTKKDDCERTI